MSAWPGPWVGLSDDLDTLELVGMAWLGASVRTVRLRCALSQRQLAWGARVSQSTVSRLETGQLKGLRLRTLARIIGSLGAPPDLFVGGPPAPHRRLPRSAPPRASDAPGHHGLV
jgi:transcriptional regulator with XRE-family HTH domain